MNWDSCWYRVFGKRTQAPDFSAFRASRRASEDDHGWYQIHFPLLSGEIELNRWLPEEDRIRPELNTWAAWVETNSEADLSWLMQHVVATTPPHITTQWVLPRRPMSSAETTRTSVIAMAQETWPRRRARPGRRPSA